MTVTPTLYSIPDEPLAPVIHKNVAPEPLISAQSDSPAKDHAAAVSTDNGGATVSNSLNNGMSVQHSHAHAKRRHPVGPPTLESASSAGGADEFNSSEGPAGPPTSAGSASGAGSPEVRAASAYSLTSRLGADGQ